MLVVAVADVTAERGLFDVHLSDVGGHAPDIDVIEVLVAIFDLALVAHLQANIFGQSHVVAQVFEIFKSDFSVALLVFDELLKAGDQRKLPHQEDVGAEISNPRGNIAIGAFDQRDNYQQSGNRQNYAQQGKKGAQLVGPQGFQGNGGRFP